MRPLDPKRGSRKPSLSKPPKLKPRIGPKPTILFVDDDSQFLGVTKECWEEFYKDDADLHTLNPKENPTSENPVAWIRNRIDDQKPLDAVFIDENIPGMNALKILDALEGVDGARYVPIVLMTAYPDSAHDTEALEKGALRYIYKNKGENISGIFLHDALFSIAQFRDQVEDVMWVDFLHEVAESIAEQKPLREVVDSAYKFLFRYFGKSSIYVRKHAGESLQLLGGNDVFEVGEDLSPDAIPYLFDLLKPGGPPRLRNDCLTRRDLGKGDQWRKLLNCRLIAEPLVIGNSRVGTVSLYRHADRHPFRKKDQTFLRHFALEISSCLGAEDEMHRLRVRQTQLAEFVDLISNAEVETEAVKLLMQFLHKDIQRSDNTKAKTSVRLLLTGKPQIPQMCRTGLPANREVSIADIYQEDSAYARVVRNRQPERYGNIPEETRDKGFLFSHTHVRSSLTVPLVSTGLCLGAVNMENLAYNYFNSEDEDLAASVANLTAYSLVKMKAQRFIKSLLALVNDLVQVPQQSSQEALLSRAFSLLHDFTGYARLLYLVPGSEAGAPWQVEVVTAGDTTPMDERQVRIWREHIIRSWDETFIRKTLQPNARMYTEDKAEIASDERLDVRTEAMEVVHLYRESDHTPVGMFALLFLLPKSVNPFQRDQLSMFGRFIGTLMEVGGNIRRILDAATLKDQEAVLGSALIMWRHKLVLQLGGIGNALNSAEDEGHSGPWLKQIRDVLVAITEGFKYPRRYVKQADFQEFDVETLWNGIVGGFAAAAAQKGITLRTASFPGVTNWISDQEIVAMILENIIDNSIFHCRRGDSIELRVTVSDNDMKITVIDTGPGVDPSIETKLFTAGVTAKSTGSGYALHFSRRRANDLKGDLVFEKGHKPGTAFTLILPKLVTGLASHP